LTAETITLNLCLNKILQNI